MRLAGAIFDLDGTLADTLPACYAAFRAACAGLDGPTYTNEEIRGLFGPSEEGMLQRAMPERWEAGLAILLAEYQRHLNLCSGLFPSVTTSLQLLRERRTPLALVTGKGPFTTKMSLTHFGLDGVFDPVEVGSPQGVVKAAAIARVVERWGVAAAGRDLRGRRRRRHGGGAPGGSDPDRGGVGAERGRRRSGGGETSRPVHRCGRLPGLAGGGLPALGGSVG